MEFVAYIVVSCDFTQVYHIHDDICVAYVMSIGGRKVFLSYGAICNSFDLMLHVCVRDIYRDHQKHILVEYSLRVFNSDHL